MKTVLLIVSHLALSAVCFPAPDTPPPLISFDKGGIGVNFLGYHARAGLGGLLTGNAADGGLHAEAGTPHGQYAGAGLGGTIDQGRSAGQLYAGATAGGGVSAAAGLGGSTGEDGASGEIYKGYSAGGKSFASSKYGSTSVKKEVEVVQQAPEDHKDTQVQKIPHPAPQETSAGISGGLYISKTINTVQSAAPPQQVVEEVQPQPQKTYIERTVIPNYVEKTIQVPSYVEKTIKVPTLVEKKIKVPAPPTVIEKEVAVPETPMNPDVFVHKIKTVQRPFVRKHWRKYGSGAVGFNSGHDSTSAVEKPTSGVVNSNVHIEKRFNGQLFNDIFNIPISTLQAVSRLVSGIGGGVSGSITASKQYNTYK